MNMTAVAIVAIVFWGLTEIVKTLKKKQAPDTQQMDALAEQCSQLQERVATLEKIVTDDRYDLKREIDGLK